MISIDSHLEKPFAKGYTIGLVNLRNVKVNIVTKYVSLPRSPHVRAVNDLLKKRKVNKAYSNFVSKYLNTTPKKLKKILVSIQKHGYRGESLNNNYILVNKEKDTVLDGTHKAAVLYVLGHRWVEVAYPSNGRFLYKYSKKDYQEFVNEIISRYKIWYQPVDFGYGIVRYPTGYPSLKPDPKLAKGRGLEKWKKQIKKNLPSVRKKRVLDLGCNTGINSIEMIKNGAREIIGIDKNRKAEDISVQFKENFVKQATEVKRAFELKDKRFYPITYIDMDIRKLPKKADKLGSFDIILALCILYHLTKSMSKVIKTLCSLGDYILVQTNLVHGGELSLYSSPDRLQKEFKKHGFYLEKQDDTVPITPILIFKKRTTKKSSSRSNYIWNLYDFLSQIIKKIVGK